MKRYFGKILIIFFIACFCLPQIVWAQLAEPKATLFISPRLETVLAGSVFDVSVFLNTNGNTVNVVDLKLKFSADKLRIVRPTSGKSFFSLWHEVPIYSNEEGTASFVGGIPEGISTESGLVTTITFEARATGGAVVEILDSSKVLASDGQGTNILSEFGKGLYSIEPKPPEGIEVYSETHPFEERWSNNNNPIIVWKKEAGVTDFSYELDNKPSTVPDNIPDSQDTIRSYENLGDGLWYFHIKARKDERWGPATHFPLRIDTAPPLSFEPRIEILAAAIITKAMVHFQTTDLLSGIDHYEVGIIEKESSGQSSPAFLRAESPYQLPQFASGSLQIIIRAIDRAGNVRDEAVDFSAPTSSKVDYIIIAAGFFILVLIYSSLRYLYKSRLKNVLHAVKEVRENK